jgi:hypothetical protein
MKKREIKITLSSDLKVRLIEGCLDRWWTLERNNKNGKKEIERTGLVGGRTRIESINGPGERDGLSAQETTDQYEL